MSLTSTSRVIDDLQKNIDVLKRELSETKIILNETKQKYSILQNRAESLVEQLSNSKHQNEITESLLKRKERRILDLEVQITDLISNSDKLNFENEQFKSKFKRIEQTEVDLTHENERLKNSYNILLSSTNEYRNSMNEKLDQTKSRLLAFIDERSKHLNNNINLIKTQEPEIMASFNLLTKNSKRLEELYSQKNRNLNSSLTTLATLTKEHGSTTSIIFEECENILKKLNRNENIILKIRNETDGNLIDLDKIKILKSLKNNEVNEISTSNNSNSSNNNNNNNNNSSSHSNNNNHNHNHNSSNNNNNSKNSISAGLLESRYNTENSPTESQPTDLSKRLNSNTTNNVKKDKRKRFPSRNSMNSEDFENLHLRKASPNLQNETGFLDIRKQRNASGTANNNHNKRVSSSNSVKRSSSTRNSQSPNPNSHSHLHSTSPSQLSPYSHTNSHPSNSNAANRNNKNRNFSSGSKNRWSKLNYDDQI